MSTTHNAEHAHDEDSWLARRARDVVGQALSAANVDLDGPAAWHPRIHRSRALARILLRGTLGAGESYVDGDWDCEALDELAARLLAAHVDTGLSLAPLATAAELVARVTNKQDRSRGRDNNLVPYDRDDELYRAMLGPTLAYSCGYWRDATTLDEAQDAKHELVCKKLMLARGQRLLDVGCGFGALARYAAERYGVEVVGVTVSEGQAELARRHCAGLPVEIRAQDYRDVRGRFDRVVSIAMFEHVGPANHRTFFERASALLASDGLMLVHTIGSSTSRSTTDPWIDRYIFPNAVVPSAAQITRATEGLFVLEDWHSFGLDYDRTLRAWHARFEAAWPTLRERFDERFRRMWRYYLLTSAGGFRAQRNHLWQIVLSRSGVIGGYRRVGV